MLQTSIVRACRGGLSGRPQKEVILRPGFREGYYPSPTKDLTYFVGTAISRPLCHSERSETESKNLRSIDDTKILLLAMLAQDDGFVLDKGNLRTVIAKEYELFCSYSFLLYFLLRNSLFKLT